jgi:hypothetical protein
VHEQKHPRPYLRDLRIAANVEHVRVGAFGRRPLREGDARAFAIERGLRLDRA